MILGAAFDNLLHLLQQTVVRCVYVLWVDYLQREVKPYIQQSNNTKVCEVANKRGQAKETARRLESNPWTLHMHANIYLFMYLFHCVSFLADWVMYLPAVRSHIIQNDNSILLGRYCNANFYSLVETVYVENIYLL